MEHPTTKIKSLLKLDFIRFYELEKHGLGKVSVIRINSESALSETFFSFRIFGELNPANEKNTNLAIKKVFSSLLEKRKEFKTSLGHKYWIECSFPDNQTIHNTAIALNIPISFKILVQDEGISLYPEDMTQIEEEVFSFSNEIDSDLSQLVITLQILNPKSYIENFHHLL